MPQEKLSINKPGPWQPILQSPLLQPIIADWHRLGMPDCWLVAGAVAQTIWNDAFGLPPAHGISDVDIIYFDADDLSEAAEAAHAARIHKVFSHLPIWFDVKNEARVHLWYREKFGFDIAPYTSSAHAISTFPTTATAVGLRLDNDKQLDIEAPFGTHDLFNLVVRPNKTLITRQIYQTKIARWRSRWPQLDIMPW